MQVERTRDKNEWNRFLRCNGGPVYNRYEWATACEVYGHEVTFLVVRHHGEIVTGVPLVWIRSRLFGNKLVSMPFSEYGSVVRATDAPNGATQLLLDEIRRFADELNADFVSLRGADLSDRDEITQKHRFVSFEIPLDGPANDRWTALTSNRRRHIRRARKNDIRIETVDSLDGLERYYGLYLRTQRGHGSPPHSFEFFRRLWETLGECGDMRIELVVTDGRAINGAIRFEYGDVAYAWGATNDYAYRDLQGGSLLTWHMIETLCEEGYSHLSLGRTRNGSGVYRYKKSFGGTETKLIDYHYFPNGAVELPDATNPKYDRIKQIWRRAPLPFTRSIGPRLRAGICL